MHVKPDEHSAADPQLPPSPLKGSHTVAFAKYPDAHVAHVEPL